WSVVPQAGDVIRIDRDSPIAGSSDENVGLYGVISASGDTVTMQSLYSLTTAAVASTSLAGETSPLQRAPGFVSSTLAGLKAASTQEKQAWVEASRITDGATFPTTRIGGQVAMEISYNLASVTAATLSIDANRVMTITPTG